MLTAAKRGEVRWAEWPEIDRSERVWTIPARRMKTNRQHRVPLWGGKPLDAHQLRWMVREHGIAAVPHGFRSSFRDWAGEETDHPPL